MRLNYVLGLAVLSLGVCANDVLDDYEKPIQAVHESDLICHTSDPTECYPKIFVPTNEFQVVHDDQAIPKGLHVRFDMETGQKEAKLLDPEDDRPVNAVEILPDESTGPESEPVKAVGVVPDQPLRDEVPHGIDVNQELQNEADRMVDGLLRTKASKAPPVKPPAMGFADDQAIFQKNIDVILDQSKRPINGARLTEAEEALISHALTELEDLCHDMYWGQELTKLQISSVTIRLQQTSSVGLGSEFSRLMATALQNNAAALEHVAYSDEDLWNLLSFIQAEGHTPKTLSRAISHVSALLDGDIFYRSFLGGLSGPGVTGASIIHQAVSKQLQAHRNKLGLWAPDVEKEQQSEAWPELKRLMAKAYNLAGDHYFSEEGKQRLNILGDIIRKEADRVGWEHGNDLTLSPDWEDDLHALCISFQEFRPYLPEMSLGVDEDSRTLQYAEAKVCKDWEERKPAKSEL